MNAKKSFIALSVLSAALLAVPAHAQPGNGNGNGNGNGKGAAASAGQGKGNSAAHPSGKGNSNGNGQGSPNNGKQWSTKGTNNSSASQGPGNGSTYRASSSTSLSIDIRFNDWQRSYVRDYYRGQFSQGHCPPGLAKKNNGCMPPGQAKKWRIGYPLGADVIFYDLPAAVIAELGPPPRGYRYARVADDILMLAVGTGLVVDAIASLSQ